MEQLMENISGHYTAALMYSLTKLDIPDILESHPEGLNPQEIESKLTTPISSGSNASDRKNNNLEYLLHTLATIQVLNRDSNNKFTNTDQTRFLTSNHPVSIKNWTITNYEVYGPVWSRFHDFLLTGAPQTKPAFNGQSLYQYLDAHDDQNKTFDLAMNDIGRQMFSLLPDVLAKHFSTKGQEITSINKVVDLGGGNGGLVSSLFNHYKTQENRSISTFVLERESTCKRYRKDPLLSNVTFVGADIFDSIPQSVVKDASVFIIKNVLHDFSNSTCLKVLGNVNKAIKESGLAATTPLIIIERLIEDPAKIRDPMLLFDAMWQRLVGEDGCAERNEDQFRSLLDEAGFQLDQVVKLKTYHSVMISYVKQ